MKIKIHEIPHIHIYKNGQPQTKKETNLNGQNATNLGQLGHIRDVLLEPDNLHLLGLDVLSQVVQLMPLLRKALLEPHALFIHVREVAVDGR